MTIANHYLELPNKRSKTPQVDNQGRMHNARTDGRPVTQAAGVRSLEKKDPTVVEKKLEEAREGRIIKLENVLKAARQSQNMRTTELLSPLKTQPINLRESMERQRRR